MAAILTLTSIGATSCRGLGHVYLWKENFTFESIARTVILLISLTQERLMNPSTPRQNCYSLIIDPVINERAIIIARNILKLVRGLLLQSIPWVFPCILIPRATHPICYDYPICSSTESSPAPSSHLLRLSHHHHQWSYQGQHGIESAHPATSPQVPSPPGWHTPRSWLHHPHRHAS